MKLPAPYKCDYCGKQKGETNHWWLALADLAGECSVFQLTPWSESVANTQKREDICGQECATKAMAKWMEAQ
jgi:hypothetical protein